MPIYEFECQACHTLTEALCSTDTKELDCHQCCGVSNRIMSKSISIIKDGTPILGNKRVKSYINDLKKDYDSEYNSSQSSHNHND